MSNGWAAPGSGPQTSGSTTNEPQTTDQQVPPQQAPPGQVPGGAAPQRELVQRAPLFPLRPLGLGEILGAAVGIYRRRPRIVFGLTSLVMGVVFILTTLATGAGMLPMISELQVVMDNPDAPVPDTFGSVSDVLATIGSSLVTGLIMTVGLQIISVVLTRLTLVEATGAPATDAELRAAMRRYGVRAVLVSLLIGALVLLAFALPGVLGFLPLILGGTGAVTVVLGVLGIVVGALAALYVWIRACLATPALVIEDLGILAAIGRSFTLTAGRRLWRVLGIVLLLVLLYTVVQQTLAGMFGMVASVVYIVVLIATNFTQIALSIVIMVVISMLGVYVATVVTTPFLAAGITTLYTDVRMRHESFDVQLRRAEQENR